jgi:DNA gyrase inhibitor GyrI
MDYADPFLTWPEWLEANGDKDETTKLLALHEYIYALAVEWRGQENITADWLNKKMAKLGMTERIPIEHRYALDVPVSGVLHVGIYAATRADALAKLFALTDGTRNERVNEVKSTGEPVFTDGPEDIDPNVVNPDAPTTVDGTLAMLREIIMLGHISGPRFCTNGANAVLQRFGLAEIPPRKKFTVTRPVQAVQSTVVEAYDEATAMRVAGWRWTNDRSGYTMDAGQAMDDPTVTPA